jgi:hypothetical protein
MNVSRKFEKQGPLWVPRYEVDTPGKRYERYRRRFSAAISRVQLVVQSALLVGDGAHGFLVGSTGAGNLLVCIIELHSGPAESVTGIVGGGTWVQVPGAVCTASGTEAADVWYVKNSTSGATTITPTLHFGTSYSAVFYEYSGTDNGNFDQVAMLNNQSPSSGPTGPSVTNAGSGDVIVSVALSIAIPVSVSGSGFTLDGSVDSATASMASVITTTSGSFAPVWSSTGGANWGGTTVSFKPAAAAPPGNQIALEDSSVTGFRVSTVSRNVTVW